MIEERTQPTGAYISYTTYFRTIFLFKNLLPSGPSLHTPRFFISRPTFATPFPDPHSRPHFATHIRDPISRLTFATHFATHIRDPLSRLTFATHFRDSRSRLHSRLHFTTRVRDHTRNSRSRLPIALPTATRHFLSQLPSCDSTTEGRTVLTPQRHLRSVPTLTLILKKLFFGTYSLACPPPLAPTHHHVHTPQWLCVP